MQVFWARLASFGQLGLISDPLIISKSPNETHDPKGQENKIYTIVKGRETKSAKKKMHLKMLSAEVICCKYLPNITDNLSIEANSVDPEQTAPGSTLFAIEAS